MGEADTLEEAPTLDQWAELIRPPRQKGSKSTGTSVAPKKVKARTTSQPEYLRDEGESESEAVGSEEEEDEARRGNPSGT